jgi:archaellum biogenesis ATPase FlaH
MVDKKELHGALNTICDEIIKDIIEPTCGVSGVMADYWLSDIATYSMDEEEENQKVYELIQEKYNLKDDEMIIIDSFTPLMQIALLIYLDGYRPAYGPFGE